MENTLEIIAIFVAVVGGFKALEWVIQKITNTHDKSQKIDENAEAFKKYKMETDAKIVSLQTQINNAHNHAQTNLDSIKKEITDTLNSHREEYIKGIDEVKQSILEMTGIYQQTVAIVEVKIDNLEKKQDKHNSVIERTYALESRADVLEEKVKVANNRILDLEKK